jgi:hypothetical protein
MLRNIKALFEFASKNGLYFPAAHDADKKAPSVTLFFAHVSFAVCTGSIIYLLYKDTLAGATAALIYWTLATVFYLMRHLTKFNVNLKDKDVSLEDTITTDKEK